MKKKINPHRGSTLKEFLQEEGIYQDVVRLAEKELLAMKLASAMQQRRMSIAMLAKRMKTSRAAVSRMLDEKNPAITLATMGKAAQALGKRWQFELVDE